MKTGVRVPRASYCRSRDSADILCMGEWGSVGIGMVNGGDEVPVGMPGV